MLKTFLFAGSALSALVSAAPAFSQSAEPAAFEAGDGAGVGDSGDVIVVTARRRSEEVQDVPISISVVDSKAIEQTGAYNLSRLTQLQPTVQFFSSNPRNTAVNIRGIGAPFGLTNDGIEQGVGFYIDQVYYNRIASTTLDFNDVERVEVLRGPQGTLYGKNTTAGAINITTRKPSFEPEGKTEIRVRGFEADFSVRPSERFSLYANGAFTDHEYRKFTDAPCPPELSGGTTVTSGQTPSAPGTAGGLSPANCDISGQWLPGVSKWAFSYGAEYNVPTELLGQEGAAYLGFDGNYRSKFSSNAFRSAYTDVDGYAISNFRLGFRTEKGWDVFGWVRNAFDANYFEQLAVPSGNTGLIVGQPGDPRTWGVTFKAAF